MARGRRPGARAAAGRRASASRASRPPSERDVYAAALEAPPRDDAPPQTTLRVTVVNGDLTFVRQPLLLGHYRSSLLTGTERVMDRLVGGAMQDVADGRPLSRPRRAATRSS